MSPTPPRCILVASTAGSVLNQALRSPCFRGLIHAVVCDQDCPAADKARAHGVPVQVHPEPDADAFGAWLLDYLRQHRIDYVFSFYTQFFAAAVRAAYPDRLVNLHPSLLPAFKGMDGFGDGYRYGARFLGSTVEFIDQRMDEGKIILQTAFPCDPAAPVAAVRHRLFVQQVKSLLQVARWLADGRVQVQGRQVTIAGARYDDPEFSPALDDPEARAWEVRP